VGLHELRARLSYCDGSDKYLGEKQVWAFAQEQIREVAAENGLDFFEAEGEAAFYGPKIDFMARDAIGREHQVATIQLDFVMPGRFGLEFVNEKGEKETPVMIHHATLGSIERFLSVFIEHTAGRFPVWCAPEQIRLILVKNDDEKLIKFAEKLHEQLSSAGIRAELDDSGDSVGKKIRSAETKKLPYSVVLGEKELAGGKLLLRIRADLGEGAELTAQELVERIADESQNRTR
jgi:threonyl-tRNA synthetase